MKLRNVFAALTLCLLAAPAAHAQTQDLRYGVLGGLNFSNFSGTANYDSTTGIIAGVFAQYPVTETILVEPQLRYIQKGAEVNLNPTTTVTTDANYIEIPVYAKYKFDTGTMILPYVFAGPSFAFKVGDGTTTEVAGGATTETDGNIKTFDLGVDLGVGGEWAMNDQLNIGVSAAYNFGLLDVADNSDAKNRGLQVYAQVGFVY